MAACVGLCLALAACGGDEVPGGPLFGSSASTPTTSRPPFQGTTLAVGEIKSVDALDGMRLRRITDGEVRSYETSVKILETGETDEFGSGENAYRAGDGGKLLGFSLSTKRSSRATNENGGQVVAAVTVDGTTRTLPGFAEAWSTQPKTLNYLVAVPKDRQVVDFELKYNTVAQRFDLLRGAAKGERPAALYRAREETVVYQEGLTPASFEVNPLGKGFDHTYTVTVKVAELGYFTFHGGQIPSAPDKAWLTVGAREDVSGGGSCSATLGAYRLTDKQGKEYPPVESASKIASPGVIDGTTSVVSFEVSADLEGATLTVAPTELPCQVSTATFKTVPARGAAKIEITLPKN